MISDKSIYKTQNVSLYHLEFIIEDFIIKSKELNYPEEFDDVPIVEEAFERGGRESVVEAEGGREFGKVAEQRIVVCMHGTKHTQLVQLKYIHSEPKEHNNCYF